MTTFTDRTYFTEVYDPATNTPVAEATPDPRRTAAAALGAADKAAINKAVSEAVAEALKQPEVAEAVRREARHREIVESFDYNKLSDQEKDEVAGVAMAALFRPGGARFWNGE